MQTPAMHLALKHQKYSTVLYNSLLASASTYEVKIGFPCYDLLCLDLDPASKTLRDERDVACSLGAKVRYPLFRIASC